MSRQTGTILARSGLTLGSLLRSTDEGTTWTAVRYPLDSVFLMPYASDSSGIVYAIGRDWRSDGRLARSIDDGITWERLPLDLNREINDVLVNKLGHIFLAVDDREHVWISKDGGVTAERLWQGMDNPITSCLAMLPDGRIMAGEKHRVYISVRFTTEAGPELPALPSELRIEAVHPQPALVAESELPSAKPAPWSGHSVPGSAGSALWSDLSTPRLADSAPWANVSASV